MKKYIGPLVFWMAVLTLIYIRKFELGLVNKNSKYSIAETYNTRWTVKSGKFIDYSYIINGKKYRGAHDIDNHPQVWDKFGRYLIAYDSLDPSKSYIFLKIELSDSIKAPDNGWSIPPNDLIVHKSVVEFKKRKWWAWYINPE